MRLRAGSLATLVVMAIVSVVGVACGGGTKSATPRQVVLASATKTVEANSSKIALTVHASSIQGVAGAVDVTASGAFDYAHGTGHMTMTMPPVNGQSIGTLEMVITGTTLYEKLPASVTGLFGGKSWVKLDLAQAARSTGLDASTLVGARSADPTATLATLRGVGEVTKVGTETLRGDTVTKYHAVIDPAKAVARAPQSQQKVLQQLADLMKGATLPADVWIDGKGRLRKMTYALDLSKAPAGAAGSTSLPASGSISTTLELYDFGTKVEVTPPPANQVSDLSQILNTPTTTH